VAPIDGLGPARIGLDRTHQAGGHVPIARSVQWAPAAVEVGERGKVARSRERRVDPLRPEPAGEEG
jgi:hypothetical protein